MKYLSSFLAITLLSFVGLAQQNKPKIYVDYFYNKEEYVTIRIFSITKINVENTKDQFVKSLGTPVKKTLGSMEWESVSIDNIGANINVLLQDGVITNSKEEVSYMVFVDKASKIKALQNLSDTKFRAIRVIFTNAYTKKDAILDKEDEEIAVKWLESNLAN